MEIHIKYFGRIAEITKTEEERIEFNGQLVSDLIDKLNSKYKALANQDFKVAQNQELVSYETKLSGAEIALLPPFSGG